MKTNRFILSFFLCFTFLGLKAQITIEVTGDTVTVSETYTEYFDSIYQHVNLTNVPYNILYDRVASFAELQRFNKFSSDTSDYWHFIQAYSELYRAAFLLASQPPYPVDSLKQQSLTNIINVGILHYRFNMIDSAVAVQKLYFDSDSILQENDSIVASLYTEHTVFLCSPLVENVRSLTVNFIFSNLLRFDNTGNLVVALQADFGNGIGVN